MLYIVCYIKVYDALYDNNIGHFLEHYKVIENECIMFVNFLVEKSVRQKVEDAVLHHSPD